MILARKIPSAQNQAFALVLCLLLSQTAGFADQADSDSAPPGAFVDSTSTGAAAASQPEAPAAASGDLGDPSIVPTASEMQVAPLLPPGQDSGQIQGQGPGQTLGQNQPAGGLMQAQQPVQQSVQPQMPNQPQGWQPAPGAISANSAGQPVWTGQQQPAAFGGQQQQFVQPHPVAQQLYQGQPGGYPQPQPQMYSPYGAPPQQAWGSQLQPAGGAQPMGEPQWGQMPMAQQPAPAWAQQYQAGMQPPVQQQAPPWNQNQMMQQAQQPPPSMGQPPLSATVQNSQPGSAPPGSWTADYPTWNEARDPSKTTNSSNSMLGSNPASGDYGYNPFGGLLPKTGSNLGFGLPGGNMGGLMMLGTALGAWLGSRGMNNNNNNLAAATTTANPLAGFGNPFGGNPFSFGNSMGFNSNPLAALFGSQTGSMTGNPLAGLMGNPMLSMMGAGSAARGFNPMMMGMNNFGINPLTSAQSRAIIGNQAFRSGPFTRKSAFSIPFPGRILNQALNRGINRGFYSSLRYIRF